MLRFFRFIKKIKEMQSIYFIYYSIIKTVAPREEESKQYK